MQRTDNQMLMIYGKLNRAVIGDDIHLVRSLLKNNEEMIFAIQQHLHDQFVFNAVRNRNLAMVRILIRYHFKVDYLVKDFNWEKSTDLTPLALAALNGDFDICKLLLEYGADPVKEIVLSYKVIYPDDPGYSPLFKQDKRATPASISKNKDILELMVKYMTNELSRNLRDQRQSGRASNAAALFTERKSKMRDGDAVRHHSSENHTNKKQRI